MRTAAIAIVAALQASALTHLFVNNGQGVAPQELDRLQAQLSELSAQLSGDERGVVQTASHTGVAGR